ncbi:MAG: FAD:protein FMN transferase [Rhodobacteraceae bacterium]|nr:FAD:protein FMN transferase [Paracoccaceae bacterium]
MNAMTRRRFLSITGATAFAQLAPCGARAASWSGRAFGAEAQITVTGSDAGCAAEAVDRSLDALRAAEAAFSLHDPRSELSRLNARGTLCPSALFAELLNAVDRAVELTGGIFDPSVQALWPGAGELESSLSTWNGIRRDDTRVALAQGQLLTFNGIAQGFASDRVSAALRDAGYDRTLVDMGEIRAQGGPWHVGLADPAAGLYGTRTLNGGALATSSPGLLKIGPGRTHILNPRDPDAAPYWSSVTVEAETATLADALSTAACHMPADRIAALFPAEPSLRAVTLVDPSGEIRTLRPA